MLCSLLRLSCRKMGAQSGIGLNSLPKWLNSAPKWLSDDFRCGALLFMVIHVIYKYKNK